MTNRTGSLSWSRSAAAVLAIVAFGLASACGDPPSAPTPTPTPQPGGLAITFVSPSNGPMEESIDVDIGGTGFEAGATVTFDGPATNVRVMSSTLIRVTVAPREAGRVDVTVTNPGGQAARLAGAYTYLALAIQTISPASAFDGERLRVIGAGFALGATVTIGGLATAGATVNGARTTIDVTIPPLVPRGSALDVVVTNPSGRSATLARAFTSEAVTLSVTQASVVAGEPLTVSWAGLGSRRVTDDWIGLFRQGESNTAYRWYEYTNGNQSGTIQLRAPLEAGTYEFRYLPNDGYVDVARSNVITVTAR